MSVERPFEAWEEVQRRGQDLTDRLAQGFTSLIQSHINPSSFSWPNSHNSKPFDLEFPTQSFGKTDFGLVADNSGINGVSAIFDIGNRIGQAGADFGACLNGMVQQFFRRLPVPFWQDEHAIEVVQMDINKTRQRADLVMTVQDELGPLTDRLKDLGFAEDDAGSDGLKDEEIVGFNLRAAGNLAKPQSKGPIYNQAPPKLIGITFNICWYNMSNASVYWEMSCFDSDDIDFDAIHI
ncbi:hypothetical protein FNV43_RR05562 [Rhamnella rubrinervis]|uniref:Uncharacterized protein n=1 Tax=Rhamnella rubrinervis TaxID=2594499 RepID=A0A8K0HP97_9ROSA|nr:hypothetical protein FNV43_RR05562 [Rhamnella rubrinervis]